MHAIGDNIFKRTYLIRFFRTFLDRPKPHTFIVRGLQMTTVVERMFCVNSEQER